MIRLETCYTFSRIPYLTYDDLEEYAEKVVYDFAPEFLQIPGQIDVDKFVEYYLGLSMEYHRICYNRKIQGMTAFNDGVLKVSNEKSGRPEPILIKKGTIIIDTSLTLKINLMHLRVTIMHEGAHWLLHQETFSEDNPFGHMGRYDNPCLAAKEKRNNYNHSKIVRTDIDCIESQANYLAAAILMPRPPLRIAYREFFKINSDIPRRIVRGSNPVDDCLAMKIPEYIAEVFGVSFRDALTRLENLNAIVDIKDWKYTF